jgi:hypothetical protein
MGDLESCNLSEIPCSGYDGECVQQKQASNLYMHACMYVCACLMYVLMCVFVHVCVCVYMVVCVCACINSPTCKQQIPKLNCY